MNSYSIRQNVERRYVEISKFKDFTGITHAFSTRNFLNMRYGAETKRMIVQKNRERFLGALGINSNEVVTLNQVHSDLVKEVTENDFSGFSQTDGDALITNQSKIPIGVLTADCIPVLLADSKKNTIAAVHAGRKGTFQEIVKKTVLKMIEGYGCSSDTIIAAIGPGIGKCCYQVPAESGKVGETTFLDLQEANRLQLLKSGLTKNNISTVDLCTACHTDLFYSYRKEKRTERMLSLIMLK